MPVQTDRLEFTPPPQRGHLRALVLALIAHGLLVAGLTVGVQWKRDAENVAVEAELWSSVVQQAAPKLVEAPPPPPQPTPRVAPPPPTPQVKDADIAVERDRRKREAEKKERELRELEKKQQAEKAEKAARDKKAAAEKLAADKRKNDEAQKREDQQAKAAEEKRRLENIRRVQGMAGASGGAEATGNAQRSSGPSANYGGRIKARVKPNITFTEDVAGNPVAEVLIQVAPSGLILSSQLTRPSGNKAWDDAVLRAIEKTEVLPRDEDGRVPPQISMTFRRFD